MSLTRDTKFETKPKTDADFRQIGFGFAVRGRVIVGLASHARALLNRRF